MSNEDQGLPSESDEEQDFDSATGIESQIKMTSEDLKLVAATRETESIKFMLS